VAKSTSTRKTKRAAKRDAQRTNGPVRVTKPASNGRKHPAEAPSGAVARLSNPRPPKPTHPCVCGCGHPTKRVFAQGHDAKVYAILRRVRDGEAKLSDVPKGVLADADLKRHMLANVS
jgi:hypothetical protein